MNPALQGYSDVGISRGVTYEDLEYWEFLIDGAWPANGSAHRRCQASGGVPG